MKSAVCVYVRNEEENILEWIIYNFVIGFDTVILMDNLSEDGTRLVAEACQSAYDVRIEEWNDTTAAAQKNCYAYVISTYGQEFDWIAFIDSDEFIVPVKHVRIPEFLSSIGEHAAIGLNWAVFGSSGRQSIENELVIKSFCMRAEADFSPNKHIKSIVRPSSTLACAHPHLFHLKGEEWKTDGSYSSDYVNAAGEPIVWGIQPGLIAGLPDLSICRVNHYFTRSRAHWDRKMQRRWRDVERPYEAFDFHDRNEVEDCAALVYLPELSARMADLS